MQRFYCDRCGVETAEYWVVSTTRVYYSQRDETFTQELCKACYGARRPPPWPPLETTDAPGYSTTALIPRKRTDQQHDDGPIRSATLGTDTSG